MAVSGVPTTVTALDGLDEKTNPTEVAHGFEFAVVPVTAAIAPAEAMSLVPPQSPSFEALTGPTFTVFEKPPGAVSTPEPAPMPKTVRSRSWFAVLVIPLALTVVPVPELLFEASRPVSRTPLKSQMATVG